jgi:signal transduction histidine kinase
MFDRSTERFTQYTERDGLPSNDVIGILTDHEGYLWLSTNNGIARFDPRTKTATNFSTANGLQGGIFRIGAAHKNKQGELFFGGENGFNVIHPSRALAPRQAPPVILTDFHVLGQSARLDSSISSMAEIRLGHDENYIAFEFAVLDFIEPSNNQYAYMLEGVDREWVEARNQRFVRYPKLAPGEYTFRVKGANSSNQWNDQGASVRLFIAPPWWKTPWAYALYVVGLMLIVSSGYRWRVRHLRRQATELKRMVEIRTEDLLAEKKKTEKQAEKLMELEQVKDRFFANISHEFRTPLTLIVGPIQDALAGEYGSVPSRLRSQLIMMHRSGGRLHRLINQLLDLSKLEVGRMELQARRRDLVQFVKGIVLSFSHLADRHGVTLQCHAGAVHLLV